MQSVCTAGYYPPTGSTTTLTSSRISCVASHMHYSDQITEQNTQELQLKSHPWQITNYLVGRWAIILFVVLSVNLVYRIPWEKSWGQRSPGQLDILQGGTLIGVGAGHSHVPKGEPAGKPGLAEWELWLELRVKKRVDHLWKKEQTAWKTTGMSQVIQEEN